MKMVRLAQFLEQSLSLCKCIQILKNARYYTTASSIEVILMLITVEVVRNHLIICLINALTRKFQLFLPFLYYLLHFRNCEHSKIQNHC